MEGAGSASTSSTPAMRRRPSYRALGSLSPPRPTAAVATFSYAPPCEEETPHFLDACHLCRQPLSRYRDIFMYRGDTPFCSEECRQEQIELDEAREEEAASYWRSRKRGHQSGRLVGESGAVAAADAPGVAAQTAVAG
ncbi:hypothetical protein Taro_047828 [Colocasia esculenta]|uniref:FLZ-type domain-containing protein n=1 Tax=Colocasia esculenta TaxID=4460 RepID=A0A843WX04_COLES|nr:hypothetical protein [Colocasia esculenta]